MSKYLAIIVALALTVPVFGAKYSGAIKVELKQDAEGNWQMMRGGEPYWVKGAGGHTRMDRVLSKGGNSVRTWSADGAEAILDEAHELGLTVCMGLWVGHERHGVDYNDQWGTAGQLEKFTETVTKLKDHPALLCWGIGNEVDLFYTNTRVWYAVQDIAAMCHKIDPNHPTMTVTAGLDIAEIQLIMDRCPDIDIMGINTYAGVGGIPIGIRQSNWPGPYLVTEWGPSGHWEVGKVEWGAPVEQTSAEKADAYLSRYKEFIMGDTEKCLGSYVFQWGNKQETTSTWYGLFMPDGSESEALDVMEYVWSGKWPENRCPRFRYCKINEKSTWDNIYLKPGELNDVKVGVKDAEGDPLKFVYEIVPESTDIKSGGDAEEKPEAVTGLIQEQNQDSMKFKSPRQRGAYRLFVYIYDNSENIAYCNIPFYVK